MRVIGWMLFYRLIRNHLAIVVKGDNEYHLLGVDNLTNRLAVAPFLYFFVGVLEQRGTQQFS